MTTIKKIRPKELFMGKLNHGGDLLQEITDICQRKNIRLGRVEAIGAVQNARLGFYDQKTREYQFFEIDQPLEIINLMGNVSTKNGAPFVHAHITLSDRTGKAYGGHLAPGTKIFACELILTTLDGPIFERSLDEETGLPLWTMSE